MRDKRFSVKFDQDTLLALRRLADANERTMAAQLRYMVRHEAASKGLWLPGPPTLAKGTG